MSNEQWVQSNFLFYPIPDGIITHVNVDVWRQKIDRLRSYPSKSRTVEIMTEVLSQLCDGVDSCVGPPGDQPTVAGNYFPDPQVDIPRMADALCT